MSKEPPPEKKVPKPQQTNKYAGPGYFNPLEDYSNSAHVASQARISNAHEQPGLGDSVSSVLRVPNPKAQPELLYDPPYLQRHRVSPLDRVSSDFGELDISDRRTVSKNIAGIATVLTGLQSSLNGHYINSSISSGYSAVAQQPTHSFDFSTSPEQMYVHSHDQPIIAHGQPQQPATVPNSLQPGHNSAYDPTSANGYQHSNRRPRIPISSSGFVPLHGHGALPSHPSEPTSLPSYNSTSHYPMQPYASVLSHTPTGYMQAAAPPSFASQPYQTSQPAPYPQYMPVISMPTPGMPAPTGSYVAPMSQQTPPASTPNALYVNGSAPPSPHDQMIHSPHAQAASLIANTGSRPLPPQPQANFGQSQTPSAYAASQGILPQQTGQPNSVSYQPPVPFPPTQPPPPPPPPPLSYNTQAYSQDNQPTLPPPPPPPPSDSEQSNARARRRSSLPRPPVNYIQPPPPPPPPLPINNYSQGQPPPPPPPVQNSIGQVQFTHPGPPPKPPIMIDNQSQWLPLHNNLSLQNGYGHIV